MCKNSVDGLACTTTTLLFNARVRSIRTMTDSRKIEKGEDEKCMSESRIAMQRCAHGFKSIMSFKETRMQVRREGLLSCI